MRKLWSVCAVLLVLSGCATSPKPAAQQAAVAPDPHQVAAARLLEAGQRLERLASASCFDYASKEANVALVGYLKLQSAYVLEDWAGVVKQSASFNASCEDAERKTAAAKQKRIEKLDSDVADAREKLREKAVSEPQAAAAIAATEVWPTIYVVKKSETLPKIAARAEIFNDPYMWPLIYKANRDQISDPRSVYAGQVLKIRRDMSLDEIIQARREAGAPEPDKIPKDAYTPKRKK